VRNIRKRSSVSSSAVPIPSVILPQHVIVSQFPLCLSTRKRMSVLYAAGKTLRKTCQRFTANSSTTFSFFEEHFS